MTKLSNALETELVRLRAVLIGKTVLVPTPFGGTGHRTVLSTRFARQNLQVKVSHNGRIQWHSKWFLRDGNTLYWVDRNGIPQQSQDPSLPGS